MRCYSDRGVKKKKKKAELHIAAGSSSKHTQIPETCLPGKRISYTLTCLSKSKDVGSKIMRSIFLEYEGQL